MKKGDLSPKVELKKLENIKNLYALGAVGYLKGEVQIFNSKPMITYVENNKLKYNHTYNMNASLLVYTQVEKWTDYKIPNNIVTRKQFEEYVEQIS